MWTCLSSWHSIVDAVHWWMAVSWLVDGPSVGHSGARSCRSNTAVFAPIEMAGTGWVTLCGCAPLQNISSSSGSFSACSQPHTYRDVHTE